ncbi:MAG: allantoate amidohydrolase [Nocardioidaceae bacterium]
MSDTVAGLMAQISEVGRDPVRGGYSRPVHSGAERELRAWFVEAATRRGLGVETDRNGIVWAWDGEPVDGAVVTGSHLDSVPGGGAFDGPLGVASALVAFDRLRARGVRGSRAIAVFPEEEGSRFGIACLGSRLLSGAIAPEKALALKDPDGLTFAEVARSNGLDPSYVGHDPATLARIGTFLELHVEQGRGLVDLGHPVAIGSSILGHGRWRISISGEGNHAGTTLMADRRDPMVAAAHVIAMVQSVARGVPDARATIGRLVPTPGGTNVIASRVDLWLDLRHPEEALTRSLVDDVSQRAAEFALAEGCSAEITEESFSPTVDFDARLRDRLAVVLPDAPILGTGAGHDAGVLKDRLPTAMLFVRNPTGVSHAPSEHVEDEDAETGAEALAEALAALLADTDRKHRADTVDG